METFLSSFVPVFIFQGDTLKEYSTGFTLFWGLFVAVIFIVFAILVLLSQHKQSVHLTETKRADANEKLVKARDLEIEKITKDHAELSEDYEAIKTEHTTLVGITVKELLNFWATKEQMEAENEDLRRQLRIKDAADRLEAVRRGERK